MPYLDMVSRYNAVRADPLFAWSLGPAYMSGLRSVLSLYLGVPDDVSARTAVLLWGPALALVAWRGSWASAVLVTLLFGPHVNSTEDVALIVVAASMPAAAVVALLTPGATVPVGWLWPLPAFVAKVGVLIAAVVQRRTNTTANSSPST